MAFSTLAKLGAETTKMTNIVTDNVLRLEAKNETCVW